MIIVYIVLLLILVYVNYRLVNRLLSENRIYVVRLIVTVISFILVYALIHELMPFVVRAMDLMYHQ
ncbi:hypothetical protein [Staphylococcus aureus]|uniref:hypothetical protein n=1 Tax=Staphylococcus aureus TaxID=1280 RepID=UPI0004F26955|nr:hypothetical protein [Staphylococcus aureus]